MKVESHPHKAYTEIRRKILTFQLLPNTRLKEDEWAKKLEISRVSIIEALTRLLGEGLLIQGAKGGCFIKAITASDVPAIRELRQILELGALRLAFKKITRGQILKLEKICDHFTTMVKQGYYSGVWEADIKFHETLMESSGNLKLLEVYRASHIPLFHYKLSKTNEYMDDYELTDSEHRKLVKAIKDRELDLAEKILTNHFLRGESIVLDLE